jgi:hypothetical protein
MKTTIGKHANIDALYDNLSTPELKRLVALLVEHSGLDDPGYRWEVCHTAGSLGEDTERVVRDMDELDALFDPTRMR